MRSEVKCQSKAFNLLGHKQEQLKHTASYLSGFKGSSSPPANNAVTELIGIYRRGTVRSLIRDAKLPASPLFICLLM